LVKKIGKDLAGEGRNEKKKEKLTTTQNEGISDLQSFGKTHWNEISKPSSRLVKSTKLFV